MSDGSTTPLQPERMSPDPIQQFLSWYQAAEQAGIPMPNTMTLATVGHDGQPAARIVLLKGVDERGFVFFTNYEGRKARELGGNPAAALVFYWLPLARQIRIEGRVEKVSAAESDAYFATRPRGHQIMAHASAQSQVLKDRHDLEQKFAMVAQTFADEEVPRPQNWGGYRLLPDLVEFWQEGESRLHDRLRYRRDGSGLWVIERLAP